MWAAEIAVYKGKSADQYVFQLCHWRVLFPRFLFRGDWVLGLSLLA